MIADAFGPRGGMPDEADNFRAAVGWALARPDADLALRLTVAARRASAGGLLPAEQSRWLDEGLTAAADVSPQTRARALHASAGISYLLGDFEKSVVRAERALRLFRDLGDDPASIETLCIVGNAVSSSGDHDRARTVFQDALELAKRASYARGIYRALHNLGELERAVGNLTQAWELLQKSATLASDAGDRALVPFILHGMADVALEQRDLRRASLLYRESLRIALQVGMNPPLLDSVAGLAAIAALARDVKRAGRLWGALGVLERETGVPAHGKRTARYEEIIRSCSDADPIAFATSSEHGRRMTRAEIADYASVDAS